MEQQNRRLSPELALSAGAKALLITQHAEAPSMNMILIILEGEGERPMAGRAHMSVACCARSVVLLDQRFARGREHCTPFGVAPQRAREL